MAVMKDNGDLVRILLEYGADMSITNFEGTSPMIFAANNGLHSAWYVLQDFEKW